MRLLSFSIRDWRNIQAAELQPGPGINVVHGDNAQGKTNLIEGIYFAATLRPFRRGSRADFVRWGAEAARLTLRCETDDRKVHLEVVERPGDRRLRVDGSPIENSQEYFGAFNVVLFTPDQLSLVKGDPAGRRAFLDRTLFNMDARQLVVVRHYNHVLRERNALLKQPGRPDDILLRALDEQLTAAGAELLQRRLWLVNELGPILKDVHAELSGAEQVQLRYQARGLGSLEGEQTDTEAIRSRLLEALESRRDQDLRRRFTTIGPHRDELDIILDGHSARLAASQGQSRTIVLALRLAELRWLREQRGEPPVLLLDDIGSELDARRRDVLFSHVADLSVQTFLTTAVKELLPTWENNKYFHAVNGDIQEG